MDIHNSSPGNDQKILFIKKCHLFRGLTDDQRNMVAAKMEVMPYPAGKMVVKQGSQANLFFMIYSGRVQVTFDIKQSDENLLSLVAGDFFGEEAFKANNSRVASVSTTEDSIFLLVTNQNLELLFSLIPDLKANFKSALDSRKLIRQKKFDWIQPGEGIYFMARKHPVLLWESLAVPIVGLLVPVILFWYSLSNRSVISLILAAIFILFDVLWSIWKWVDWGNDYYIVTNKRVIWLEKVIGIYDSRQEAPLNSIISVGVETNQVGRIYRYGNVIVRTFVGRIIFHHVPLPYQAASLVEEHWVRAREITRREDAAAMNQAMRESLGLSSRVSGQPAQQKQVVQSEYKPGLLQVIFSNIFKIRLEDNGIITYRKHWFVLIKNTWLPGSLLILSIGATVYESFRLLLGKMAHLPPPSSTGDWIVALLVGAVFIFGWWFYQYLNWHNDIFQVTNEQIIDIDKTPLGSEERRVAPLENILSTEYKRIGLAQVLLNYGNVYITVGGAQLVFSDVSDPPAVQQDIDQRRIAIISQKKEAETRAERERLADWFAAYHRDSDSFRTDEAQTQTEDLPDGDEFEVK